MLKYSNVVIVFKFCCKLDALLKLTNDLVPYIIVKLFNSKRNTVKLWYAEKFIS